MKAIGLDLILPYAEYERVRAVLRPLFIAEKERRRLALGEHVTLLFENLQTVWYQVEEMLRVERIAAPEAIRHEIETYSELLPSPQELSATVLIEYAAPGERDAALQRLVGLEQHVWLVIDGRRQAARFDTRQMSRDRISAVQFARFPLGDIASHRLVELADAGRLAFEADHPELSAMAIVSGSLGRALAADLEVASVGS